MEKMLMNFVKEGRKIKVPVLAVKAVGGVDWSTSCHAHFTLEETPPPPPPPPQLNCIGEPPTQRVC